MGSSYESEALVAGKAFELNLELLFLYRCYHDKNNFKLYRQKRDAGKFNDLVFELEENGTTVYRLLQAKHSINPGKRIDEQMLFSGGRGDFDLAKYLESYRHVKQNYSIRGQIVDVIICTNLFVDENLITEMVELVKKDKLLDMKVVGSKPNKFRIKATQETLCRIENEWKKFVKRKKKLSSQPAPTMEEIRDYLNHLTFVCGMPDVNELGFILEDEIGEDFTVMTRKAIYDRALKRIGAWIEGNDRRDIWTYKDAEAFFDDVMTDFKLPRDVHYNIQPPIKQFIGRTDQLKDLHKLLQDEKRAMISGLGGIGKTELVRMYIEKHSREYDNNILWIDATNDETLAKSFRDLAINKLRIKTKNENDEEVEIGNIVQEVYQWFTQSNSLFIFDNADWQHCPPYIRPSLPKNINEPHIIITSRRKWKNENIVKLMELKIFTETESIDLISNSLSKYLNNDQQDYSIKKLVETLQYLPLALMQAIAYISDEFEDNGKTYQISKYVDNLPENSEEYLNHTFSDYCESGYTKTVWTTWDDLLKALQCKLSFTSDLLNCMSFLLPDNINKELLSKLLGEDLKLKQAVRLLNDYSLITVLEKVCNVHRLVQLVTREKLKPDEKRKILVKILGAVVENDAIVARSVDHFISAWKHFKKICSDQILKYYHIPVIIALILFNAERHEEAYFFGVEALKLISLLSFIDEKGERYIQDIAPIIIFKMFINGDHEEAQEILQIHRALEHGFGRLQNHNYHKNLRGILNWKLEEEGLVRERMDSGLGLASDTSSRLKSSQESLLEVTDCDDFDSVIRENLEHLKKLIDESPHVNMKKDKEWIHLHEATSAGKPEIAGFLLQMGAEEFENAVLHAAIASQFFTIAKVLLDTGFDESEMLINAKKKSEENTVLHIASVVGLFEMEGFLPSHGAVVDVKNNENESPMEVDTRPVVPQSSSYVAAQPRRIRRARRKKKAFDLQGPEKQPEPSDHLKAILTRKLLEMLLEIAKRYETNHN